MILRAEEGIGEYFALRIAGALRFNRAKRRCGAKEVGSRKKRVKKSQKNGSQDPPLQRLERGKMNFARDGVNFDAAAAGADLRAERMLALFFDDDRDVRANFAASGFGEQMKIGTTGDANGGTA